MQCSSERGATSAEFQQIFVVDVAIEVSIVVDFFVARHSISIQNIAYERIIFIRAIVLFLAMFNHFVGHIMIMIEQKKKSRKGKTNTNKCNHDNVNEKQNINLHLAY